VSGSISVTAVEDAVIGKDMTAVQGGALTIKAGADGTKSNNDKDAAKGFVVITGGTFSIEAANDGIQAETALLIQDGDFKLLTGGGYTKGEVKIEEFGGRPGEMAASAASGTEATDETPSMKGIKAGTAIVVSGGTFSIDSADDAVHSNGLVGISGGKLTLATGDDGIHADSAVTISGGSIDITNSYEGVEGTDIVVSGGEISCFGRRH